MKNNRKTLCDVCAKTFSNANIARHKRCMHTYCIRCQLLVSRKRHQCFKNEKSKPIPIAPKLDEHFMLIYVPILIQKNMYTSLEPDTFVWPLYNINQNQYIADKVKDKLKKDCMTCFFAKHMEVEDC